MSGPVALRGLCQTIGYHFQKYGDISFGYRCNICSGKQVKKPTKSVGKSPYSKSLS